VAEARGCQFWQATAILDKRRPAQAAGTIPTITLAIKQKWLILLKITANPEIPRKFGHYRRAAGTRFSLTENGKDNPKIFLIQNPGEK
jgi:hypothetical protein